MKRLAAIGLVLALLSAPAVSAGTASKPELTDEAGDDVSSLPGLGAKSVDLTKAWVDQETPDSFTFIMDVGDDFAPDPTETLAYEWTLDVAGATYVFGAEVWNMGASTTTTPTGTASDASHNGAGLMTIIVPRAEFTDIAPGQRMDNIIVTTEAYVVSATIWSDSDQGAGDRAYVIGSQADPTMDFDGDGHSDAEEIAQGTDPTDPEDPPAFTPPTLTAALNETGGTYSILAPSAYSEPSKESWSSELSAANVTWEATVEEGSLHILFEDAFGELVNFTVDATGNGTASILSAEHGNWNLTVTPTDFAGEFSLTLAGLESEAAPADATGAEDDHEEGAHDEHQDVDSGEGEPSTKKTPMPMLAPAALAFALALRGRRD